MDHRNLPEEALRNLLQHPCRVPGCPRTIRMGIRGALQGLLILLTGFLTLAWIHDAAESRSAETRFKLALVAADAGRWIWDLRTNRVDWDAQMFHLYGRNPMDWDPSYEGFESCLVPEDVARVRELVERSVAERSGYQAIFRVVGDDGRIRTIRASGRVDPTGSYMTGICLPAWNNGVPVD